MLTIQLHFLGNILLLLNQHLLVERCSVRCSTSRAKHPLLGTGSVIDLSAQYSRKRVQDPNFNREIHLLLEEISLYCHRTAEELPNFLSTATFRTNICQHNSMGAQLELLMLIP